LAEAISPRLAASLIVLAAFFCSKTSTAISRSVRLTSPRIDAFHFLTSSFGSSFLNGFQEPPLNIPASRCPQNQD
jgi:hypothetical protein